MIIFFRSFFSDLLQPALILSIWRGHKNSNEERTTFATIKMIFHVNAFVSHSKYLRVCSSRIATHDDFRANFYFNAREYCKICQSITNLFCKHEMDKMRQNNRDMVIDSHTGVCVLCFILNFEFYVFFFLLLFIWLAQSHGFGFTGSWRTWYGCNRRIFFDFKTQADTHRAKSDEAKKVAQHA